MSVRQSSELNFTSDLAQHGSYRQSRVLPLGEASATLATGSTTEFQIEIPNKVYNLSKSTIDFKMSIAATDGDFSKVHKLGALNMFDRISLYTREGVYLTDVVNAADYSRIVTPYVTKMSDFLTNEKSLGGTSEALASAGDKGFNNFRSNVPVTTATPVSALGANGTRISSAGASEEPDVGSTEPTYFVGAADNTAVHFNYSIPLSEIHHTLMSVNRDMYFGQSLILRVHFAGVDKFAWHTTTAEPNATPASIVGAVKVSNVRLYLAVETNPVIIQGLVQRVQSQGLQMVMPYVYSYLYSSSSGTSSSVSQRLNAGHGQRLLNVYHALHNTSKDHNLAQDISNIDNAKLVSFQSNLDNQNLQEFVPLCAENEDYVLMKPILENSVIQSSNVFKANRCWIDSWRKGRSCDWKENDTVIDGLPLDSERIWNIEQTTAEVALRQYTFFVVQRTLNIDPSGIISVN